MIGGSCSPVSDYCNTYDNITGLCTSCYPGFLVNNGYCYKTIVSTVTQQQQTNNQGYLYSTSQNQTALTLSQGSTTQLAGASANNTLSQQAAISSISSLSSQTNLRSQPQQSTSQSNQLLTNTQLNASNSSSIVAQSAPPASN